MERGRGQRPLLGSPPVAPRIKAWRGCPGCRCTLLTVNCISTAAASGALTVRQAPWSVLPLHHSVGTPDSPRRPASSPHFTEFHRVPRLAQAMPSVSGRQESESSSNLLHSLSACHVHSASGCGPPPPRHSAGQSAGWHLHS